MSKPKVRLASIGVGGWGRVLADKALATERAEITVAYARSPEARSQFAAAYGARAAQSLDDVWSADVDGVLIATPHSTHAEIVLSAIRHGKHVLVEKPLTLTVADAQRCVDAAKDAGVVLAVGHNRRKQTAIRKLRDMIDAGDLGIVHHVDAYFGAPTAFSWPPESWRRDINEMPLGAMTVMGVHMVDTVLYLFGRPRSVFALSKRVAEMVPVDEATALLLDYEGGPITFLGTSPVIPPAISIAVRGTEGSAWSEEDGTRMYVQTRSVASRSPIEFIVNDADAMVAEDFVISVQEGSSPESNGAAALDVVKVMEAAEESVRSARPVEVRW